MFDFMKKQIKQVIILTITMISIIGVPVLSLAAGDTTKPVCETKIENKIMKIGDTVTIQYTDDVDGVQRYWN